MSISNELSADVAAALVAARDEYPVELSELKELILEFHSALQKLAEESRNLPPQLSGKTLQRDN